MMLYCEHKKKLLAYFTTGGNFAGVCVCVSIAGRSQQSLSRFTVNKLHATSFFFKALLFIFLFCTYTFPGGILYK